MTLIRTMNDDDPIQPLYLAIGYIVLKWSFVEAALDFASATIYTECGGNAFRKQMPKFLRDKCAFIAKAVNTLPRLLPFKAKAENITGRIINMKDLREDFAHSVLSRSTHADGVYSFARLDAKDHDHDLKQWTFDVREFPATAIQLEQLVIDVQDFAHSLEAFLSK